MSYIDEVTRQLLCEEGTKVKITAEYVERFKRDLISRTCPGEFINGAPTDKTCRKALEHKDIDVVCQRCWEGGKRGDKR